VSVQGAPTNAEPNREVLVWHDRVHEQQDSESLHFWRLSFSPSYEREKIFKRLAEFYHRAGIKSHIAYETLGDYDLLLRMWVPRRFGPEDIELQLFQALQECKLWNINYLVCHTHVHWSNPLDRTVQPSDWPSLGDPVVRDVNEFNRLQASGDPQPHTAEIDALLAKGVLRAIPIDTRGIRFFIVFDQPRVSFNPRNRHVAVARISEKCTEVLEDWAARDLDVGKPQLSIYDGTGPMSGGFLVMARAPHGYFHTFVHDITLGLRSAGLDALYDMRPYTHVMADEMFSEFTEERSLSSPLDASELDFDVEEDELLEFKATFSLNFRRFMAVDRQESDDDMIGAVIRTVTGFLNAPDGGTLVIGVLEVRRELKSVKDKAAYLRKLQERFGYEAFFADDDIPFDLPNAVIGVEAEVGEGRLFPDQDKYLQRLSEALRTQINPNPWPSLTVSLPTVDGRHVCVIKATPPDDAWYYAKSPNGKYEEFFVREATSTRAYVGTEADRYKRAHPRNTA